MSKHTPGPWCLTACENASYGDPEDIGYWIRESPSSSIPGLPGMVLASVISDCVGDCLANANLIAAAPDLLEALENLIDAYLKPDYRIRCNGIDCGCMGATNRDLAEHYAKEAIARAKGEKP